MSYNFSEGIYNTYLYLANWGKTKVECSICGTRFYSYMSEEERLKSEAEGNKGYYCSEGCMMTLIARSEREKLDTEMIRGVPRWTEADTEMILNMSPVFGHLSGGS